MKTKVTEEGVLIPRELLQGVEEVDIRKERNMILITPVDPVEDSISELGKHPIIIDLDDVSANHDHYIYGRS